MFHIRKCKDRIIRTWAEFYVSPWFRRHGFLFFNIALNMVHVKTKGMWQKDLVLHPPICGIFVSDVIFNTSWMQKMKSSYWRKHYSGQLEKELTDCLDFQSLLRAVVGMIIVNVWDGAWFLLLFCNFPLTRRSNSFCWSHLFHLVEAAIFFADDWIFFEGKKLFP